MWVLEYENDLDADFLVFYNIDLAEEDIPGPRFFALAHRVTAYGGVMAARVENETPQTSSPAAPRSDRAEVTEVSLMQMQVMFPGMIDHASSGPEA